MKRVRGYIILVLGLSLSYGLEYVRAQEPAQALQEQANQEARDLLEQLKVYEKRLLESNRTTEGAGAVGGSSTLEKVRQQNAILQSQQENLLGEILKYRQKIQSLQDSCAEQAGTTAKKDLETLREKLSTEEKRSEEFEIEVKRLNAIISELKEVQQKSEQEQAAARSSNSNRSKQLEEIIKQEAEDRQKVAEELEQARKELTAREEQIVGLNERLERAVQDAQASESIIQDKLKQTLVIPELQAQLAEIKNQLSAKESEIKMCSEKLQDKEQIIANIPGLRKQLVEARNALLLKETESQLFGKKSAEVKPVSRPLPVQEQSAVTQERERLMENSGRLAGEESIKAKTPAVPSDVMIVEVKSRKVNLRSGPGPENAPVMQVERGMRLTVEAREGDWYRVITPTGSRAYIKVDVVAVASGGLGTGLTGDQPVQLYPSEYGEPGPKSPAKPAARVNGHDSEMVPFGEVSKSRSDAEEAAFKKLKTGFSNKTSVPVPVE